MRDKFVVLLVLAFLLAATGGAEAKELLSGTPQFDVQCRFLTTHPRPAEPCSLEIMAYLSEQYGSGQLADIQVTIPPGIEHLSGPLSKSVHISLGWLEPGLEPYSDIPPRTVPSRGVAPVRGPIPPRIIVNFNAWDNHWPIVVRFTTPGKYEIRGFMRIDQGPSVGVDETDFVQPVEVRADRILYGPSYPSRHERVVRGQRYRFGAATMVPIDSSEAVVLSEITRGEVLKAEPAICADCPGNLPREIPFFVYVNVDGSYRGAEYRELESSLVGDPPDPRVVDAAREALKRWRFKPARAKGRNIVDWLFVRVEVRRQK